MTRVAEPTAGAGDGVRVVVDARPIQEPDRSPLTAWYLDRLLRTFAADPHDDDAFILVSRALRPDPAADLSAAGLPVAASRRIPPTTRTLRSAGLTLDSILLRAAELGAPTSGDATVFHTAGGAAPIASRLPVVATILDMAPWELPEIYQSTAAARFGHRLRARVLRDAARIIVCSRAVGESARRRLHMAPNTISVIPLAVDDDLLAAARDDTDLAAVRARLDLDERYIAFVGRYDARKDLRTLLEAAASVGSGTNGGRSRSKGPLRLVLALDGGADEDLARAQRLAGASGASDVVSTVAISGWQERAAVLAGAQAVVQPALVDATGIGAMEALALGVPVICSRAGALPETVGSAGIVVEPGDPGRMAAALEAIWAGGSLAQQLHRQARRRATGPQRTWADVATETRAAYAAAAGFADAVPSGDTMPGRSVFGRFGVR